MKLAVIDYGSGNLQSVGQALMAAAKGAEVDIDLQITAEPDEISRADRIILPGVGAFAECAAGLDAITGLKPAVAEAVLNKGRPFLGICVGMQLMVEEGLENGSTPGLSWLSGTVKMITPEDARLKIPHMGWNQLRLTQEHPLWQGVDDDAAVYFLHSFAVTAAENVLAETDYAGPVIAAIGRDNMIGLQFHPEKSQSIGQHILANWITWKP